VLTDANNRVAGVEVEDTKLEPKGADLAAVGLKTYYSIPCDSVVFAVGDRVDDTVGLPYKNGIFITSPHRTTHDPDDSLFQAYDETTGQILPGLFLCGWARKASEGLVGVAKRDGEWCAEVLFRYLADRAPLAEPQIAEKLRKLEALLAGRQPEVVRTEDLLALSEMERVEGERRDIEEFKFPTNEEMMAAIRQKKHVVKESVLR
jgi:ferredoxin--NADP+ reductase